MVDPEIALRLPLVNHLVQQRVPDFPPAVSLDVEVTDGDLERAVCGEIEGQFA